MSRDLLPKTIDPIRMAKERRIFNGSLQLRDMPRLCTELSKTAGEVSVTLEFDVDAHGYCFVHGTLDTILYLECQRCLQPFEYPIQSEFDLSPVSSDHQAEMLPTSYDPLMHNDEPVDTVTMIEDEILLQLPIAAMHEPAHCRQKIARKASEADLERDSNNPFNVLKDLKKK